MLLNIPFFRQATDYSCGPASLEMVLKFMGDKKSELALMREAHTLPETGTRHRNMIETAQKEGFYCYVNEDSSLEEIKRFLRLKLPVIVHFIEPSGNEPDGHYSVVAGTGKKKIILNDPWNGRKYEMLEEEFVRRWHAVQNHHQYRRWIMVISKEPITAGKEYKPLKTKS